LGFFYEQIIKGDTMTKEEQYRELLVYIIQTLDEEFNHKVQDNKNPIGLIRDKVDKVLNH
jgi:hypothetical protein